MRRDKRVVQKAPRVSAVPPCAVDGTPVPTSRGRPQAMADLSTRSPASRPPAPHAQHPHFSFPTTVFFLPPPPDPRQATCPTTGKWWRTGSNTRMDVFP